MSSVKRIICLANSKKEGERCIAGIDIDTGKWVRPVCDSLYPKDGKVPRDIRLVDGREPELLDVLEISLADTGNDFGFECENLSIIPNKWKYLGKSRPNDLIQYCGNYHHILHNSGKNVTPSYLRNLSFEERRTLQLVRVNKFDIEQKTTSRGGIEWRGTIQSINGQRLSGVKITDLVFIHKLNQGYDISGQYLITMSLGMPWAYEGWEGEIPCWKLISGVIELPNSPLLTTQDLISQTDVEMVRVDWTRVQGRDYLVRNFDKKSRLQLTIEELQKFLAHLKSLPNHQNNFNDDFF